MNVSRPLYSLLCLFLLSAIVHADPRIQYSTYLSGSKTVCTNQFGNPCAFGLGPGIPYARPVAIAADAAGNIYVAGITNETDFPNTKAQKVPLACETDGQVCYPVTSFLAKFSASGGLLYSVFLPFGHQAYALVVDSSGNAYVVGDDNLGQQTFRGSSAVMDKFTSTGTLAYQFSISVSACAETALALALNSTGTAAYVGGTTGTIAGCSGIATTPGAYESDPNNLPGIWIVKLNLSTPPVEKYGTYVGPLGVLSNSTQVQTAALGGLAVDSGGNAYITGWVNSQIKWPTTAGAYRTTAAGGLDGFVTKLNSTGTGLVYSTYVGGTGTDLPTAVRVDSGGQAYIAGTTTSSTFPHSRTFGSGTAISFLARLNSSGNSLLYSTLMYGDSASAMGLATALESSGPGQPLGGSNGTLALDSGGNSYLVGFTNSTGFLKTIAFQSGLRGAADLAYTALDLSGSPTTSSYLGGSGSEAVLSGSNFSTSGNQQFSDAAIFVDKAWNSYVVGTTNSTDFPVTTNAFQKTLKGKIAVFLTKIIIDADLSLTASPSPSPVTHGTNLTYTYAVTNKGPDSSDGDTLTTNIPTGTTFVSFTTTGSTCSPPAVGGTGAFTCKRSSPLLAGHSWGPITLTVKVNTASGGTVSNVARVAAKTQDVNTSNNSAPTSVKVQ